MATSLTITLTRVFAALTTAPMSYLDDNFSAIVTALSGKATAISDVDTEIATILRGSLLAGLGLSNDAGTPNSVIDVAAGSCASSDFATLLVLGAFTGSTAGTWVAGTGNNKLDAGAVAVNTWYHVYVIGGASQTPDILFSTSATAPTLPGSYTKKRRIGSFKTATGTTNILTFTQTGDYFRWKASILDVNTTNPGAAAVLATLTVPTGVTVQAVMNVFPNFGTSGGGVLTISDPAANDEAASATATPLGVSASVTAASGYGDAGRCEEWTNTSAQIRYRLSASGVSDVVRIATLGWYDRRGKDL